VGREALESSSAVLQTAARPSQLPAQTKKARHRVTPGLEKACFNEKPSVTNARDTAVARPIGRHYGLRLSARYSTWIHKNASSPQLSSAKSQAATCLRYVLMVGLTDQANFPMHLNRRKKDAKVRDYSQKFLHKAVLASAQSHLGSRNNSLDPLPRPHACCGPF
jgi:hypothetical protein